MEHQKPWLMGRATIMLLVAAVAALIPAQWNHETLPFVALGAVLVLMVVKSRWVVMDFMGLRGVRPRLCAALVAWPTFFALAAAAKAVLLSL